MEAVAEQRRETLWMGQAPGCTRGVQGDYRPTQATSNIRAVGFIAKPTNIHDLTASMKGQLIKLLRQAPGFAGAIILHAHKESRNVTVLTFWETEMQATDTCWEQFQAVRKLIAPLVDVCTKVQTFQGIAA